LVFTEAKLGTFVGLRSFEQFILPLILQALSDADEFVVENVINSLTSLSEIGLIYKSTLKDSTDLITPLLGHPNQWIRYSVVGFLVSVTKSMKPIDTRCIFMPIISPFLTNDVSILAELTVLENLKPHVTDPHFRFQGYSMNNRFSMH
jgi:phosphoinositide-3-kinase regulatory subunit 4